MTARFLFFFDFDKTIINEDSDYSVVRTAPQAAIPASLDACYRPGYFLEHSQRILTFLHECGVTEGAIRNEIQRIPPAPGGRALLDFLCAVGDFECVILSDSNSYYIETWLHNAGHRKLFSQVFTNPSGFHASGRLILRPFHTHSCPRCPENMCKQAVLKEYIQRRVKERREAFTKVFYMGDGENDICPTLALEPNDAVFPRKGFPMHAIIQTMKKLKPGEYKPLVVPWEKGDDVVDYLKKFLEEK